MTDNQKIKISIAILTSLGIVKSQKELAAKMGYDDPSSFSQIINGHVPIPKKFIEKLRSTHEYVDSFWKRGFGGVRENDESLEDENKRLKKEKEELLNKVISLQDKLLDKSLSPNRDIIDDKL